MLIIKKGGPMLSLGQIVLGALMSAVAGGALVALTVRGRRYATWGAGAVAAFVGPFAWNLILAAAGGAGFFVDAPIPFFPVSWQDTGSGVFTLAAAGLMLGLGPMAREPGRRVAVAAAVAAAAPLLVDIFLY
uniref:hypothetical protein n=1 Tax=Arthrobacter sp. Chr15 TaxID=447032 RepID=UPI001F44DC48|nr:hypothetical protein [Arthrobacter sp. Chr15]